MGRKANQQRQTLIVLAAVGAGLLLACFAGAGFVALTALVPAKKPAKVYEREELRALLDGKTKDEVVKLLGRPDRTDDADLNGDVNDWTYYDLSFDKVSGHRDGITSVLFRDGKVVRVHSF